ncbi:MAG TPA: hypothetical protein VGV62_09160 [Xanthobacteraceae bacterium]|nr:hypothetical protein [Xanthobacteraceae bacterium]
MPMIQERLAFCAMMIARPLSNFGGGGAVGESTFVGPVSGALPFSNPDNAKWTAGKSSSAAGDATKDHKQYTQHPSHGSSPRISTEENAITGCIAANNDEATFARCLNEQDSFLDEKQSRF